MSATIVETKYGKIQGEKHKGIYVWRGIPYAKPPIGTLRFKPPQPPSPWSGVRNATEFAPGCPQPPNPFSKILGEREELKTSEDCLYLNVWSPRVDGNHRPVMVFIHGGGFWFDAGSNPWYDGTSFAKLGDVILVTINYRLGPLGFMHLKEIGGENYAASGNCGLLDQVEALKWVKENISAFGGDPNRVTIFGESAGAMSVALLMGMPSAQGLFNKAILESFAGDFFTYKEEAAKMTKKFLNFLNIKEEELLKLETLPVETLLEATEKLKTNAAKSAVFLPIIDEKILPFEPLRVFELGINAQIPVLLGTNKDEDHLRAAVTPGWCEMDDEQIKNSIEKTVGPLWTDVSSYYLQDRNKGEMLSDSVSSALSAFRFVIPTIKMSESLVRGGSSVWVYHFHWQTPMFNGELGSCHYLEIPFVFNHLNHSDAIALTGDSPQREHLAIKLHQAWIAFARSGSPNTPMIPDWPSYDLTKRSTMIFNIESELVCDPNREERLIWEKAMKRVHV